MRMSIILKRSFHYNCCNHAKDYYKILGLRRSARGSEIKRAYRELIQKHATGAYNAKFQELSEAYKVLGDEKWRSEYDRFDIESSSSKDSSRKWDAKTWNRRIFSSGSAFRASRDRPFTETDRTHFFGRWGRKTSDLAQEVSVNVSFEEAARGVQKMARINVLDPCKRCRGSGNDPRLRKITCPYCEGSGMIILFFKRCNYCGGHGHFIKPCSKCDGNCDLLGQKMVNLDIPAGIADGQVFRTRIERIAIYANVHVAPSLRHRREKEHIFTDVEVSMAQAALGGTIEVPGIFDTVRVHVPPGTSSHTQMCLKGKGIKRMEQPGYGDQILNIKIAVPKTLTPRQRQLMLEFAKLESGRAGSVDGMDNGGDGGGKGGQGDGGNEESKEEEEDKGGKFKWTKKFF